MSARDDYPTIARRSAVPSDWSGECRLALDEIDRLRNQVVCQQAAATHDPTGADHLADAVRLAEENDRLRSRPTEEAIRKDERERLAALIEADAETLGGFTMSGERAIQLLAYMLRLDNPAGERFIESRGEVRGGN